MRCFHFSLDYYLLWIITAFLLWQWCVKSKILQKSAIVILLNLEQYQFPYYRHFILEEMHPLTCIWKVASFGLPTFNTCKSQTNFYLQEYLPACLNTWIVMQIELNSLVCSHVASSNMFLSMHIEHWNQLAWVWFCPVTAFSQPASHDGHQHTSLCVYLRQPSHKRCPGTHTHVRVKTCCCPFPQHQCLPTLQKAAISPHLLRGWEAGLCGMWYGCQMTRRTGCGQCACCPERSTFHRRPSLSAAGGGSDTKGLISARWKKWCT